MQRNMIAMAIAAVLIANPAFAAQRAKPKQKPKEIELPAIVIPVAKAKLIQTLARDVEAPLVLMLI